MVQTGIYVWCGVVWCGVVWCGTHLIQAHPITTISVANSSEKVSKHET